MDFVCTYCGKKFMRKGDLIIHNRSHTGGNGFFRSLISLIIFYFLCLLERPFKCEVCDKSFAAKQICKFK